MKFDDKNVGGKWTTLEITAEEASKITDKTIKYNYDLLKRIMNECKDIPLEGQLAIFHCAQQTYYSFRDDFLNKQLKKESGINEKK